MESFKNTVLSTGNTVTPKQNGVNILLGDSRSGGLLYLRFRYGLPLFFLAGES